MKGSKKPRRPLDGADGALAMWGGEEDVKVRAVHSDLLLLLLFSVKCTCWGKGIFLGLRKK